MHELTREPTSLPVVFLHGARDGQHHPLAAEVSRIAARHNNVLLRVAYSRPHPEDVAGADYHVEGRIDETMLRRFKPAGDAEYFLCGPPGFLADVTGSLSRSGVAGERIHVEQF